MLTNKKEKIGRNDKCPCGSGKKYKKCHLNSDINFMEDKSAHIFQQMQAKEFQCKEQQGLGREIISADFQGHKFVAVGSHLLYSKKWKTFYDFLNDYIKNALGSDWGNDELRKDFTGRHPVLQWYQYYCELQQKNKAKEGEITSVPHIGASTAYFGLAYNLYLLQHNKGIQEELIRRVKLNDKGNFYGALYETYVAAHFIKAGFDLEFENELDGSTTHCEFTATHKETGRKFSVEAKVIAPKKKGKPSIVAKLNDAFKKQASHERIIFVDIGKPAGTYEEAKKLLLQAAESLRELENSPRLKGQNHPPAYVIITNNSFWYDLKGQNFKFAALGEGFKIPSFKHDYKDTIQNALVEREKHKEVFGLLDSMHKHQEIPATFDGENPELAFNSIDDGNPPLLIGNRYLIPSDKGDVAATLRHVIVDEGRKLAIGAYDVDGGGSSILSCPLSDVELAAYKKHPRTFFGDLQPKTKIDDPLEFYDWLYNCYRNTPKEKLLEFMSHYPNIAELKKLSQEELAKLYCQGAAEAATIQGQSSEKSKEDL